MLNARDNALAQAHEDHNAHDSDPTWAASSIFISTIGKIILAGICSATVKCLARWPRCARSFTALKRTTCSSYRALVVGCRCWPRHGFTKPWTFADAQAQSQILSLGTSNIVFFSVRFFVGDRGYSTPRLEVGNRRVSAHENIVFPRRN